jgi:hypothetical protein
MQLFLNIWIAISLVVIAWGLALAGLGYVIRRCRRLIGRLLIRQHSP